MILVREDREDKNVRGGGNRRDATTHFRNGKPKPENFANNGRQVLSLCSPSHLYPFIFFLAWCWFVLTPHILYAKQKSLSLWVSKECGRQ